MNILEKTGCRTVQSGFWIAHPPLPYREPMIFENNGDVPVLMDAKKLEVFYRKVTDWRT